MIIYFSGTGNSISVARGLAQALGDSALHINKALELGTINDRRVGFVYPTYFNDMPVFVKESIDKLNLEKSEYIFAIATHGGDPGNAVYTAKKILADRGQVLSYGAEIIMPVNSRIAYGRKVGGTLERIKDESGQIDKFTSNINSGFVNTDTIREHKIATVVSKLSTSGWVKKYSKKNVNHERCVQCKICMGVCPVGNIEMIDGKIVIGNKCVECYACLHWCPQAAIGFRKKTTNKINQYHHPDVELGDIMDK